MTEQVQENPAEPEEVQETAQEAQEGAQEPQPTAERVTTQVDTTTADAVSPLPVKGKNGAPPMQIKRLKEYLDEYFPVSSDPHRPAGEHPADTAIRLLTALGSGLGPTSEPLARCSEQYCNKPAQHADDHGWVNYG